MNRTQHRRTLWVQGSLTSWMAGVTLGTVLGVTLLIVTPRLMAAPGQTAKAPAAAEQSSASAPAGSAMAGSPEPAGGTAAKPDPASTAETAATNAPTTETPADNQTSGGETPAAQSPAVSAATTGEPAQQDTNATAEPVASAQGEADAAPTPNAAEGNAEAGTEIFAGNCAGCHGAQGGGGIGPSLVTNQGPKAWTLAQFTTVLRKGVLPEGRELSAVMPRFSDAQLSDTQVADLLAHIKTLN